jgi:G6PDH family F420-dependent oxidoreductase
MLGYSLSSEEHDPLALVRHAERAEDVGFPFALISDHFHPWLDRQGESSFVWTVIGGIAKATHRLRLGTGVTCPMMRIHPAIIAQAAATAAAMMPERFFLGVGTGENLNEHILADRWPSAGIRLEMLEEAVAVIRKLWQGGMQSHRGRYFTVENARIYTLPDELPPILVAASQKTATELAARIGDGFIGTTPSRELVERFDHAGGSGKPRYGHLSVCWAKSEAEARTIAHQWWPNAAAPGPTKQELPLPDDFEAVVKDVTPDQVAKEIVCGPDPEKHLGAIREYFDAGYDHVYVHQVGPDQEGFFRFYEREILPHFRDAETGRVPDEATVRH